MVDPTGPFRAEDRLLRSREFQDVSRRGRRTVVRAFVFLAAPRRDAGSGGPRLGITASRRVGGAVVRNRVKRHVREWFRRARPGLRGDLDIVVIARSAAAELGGPEVAACLDDLARRSGALKP